MGRLRAFSDFKESGDDERPMYGYCLGVEMKYELEAVPLEMSLTREGFEKRKHNTYCDFLVGLLQLVIPPLQHFGGGTNSTGDILVVLEYMLVSNALRTVVLIRLGPQ
jgi:hypothetical protein